jgi:hypothetical protein
VRELPSLPYDRRSQLTLVFVSDDVMRRVRHYPPNWFELADEELLKVSLTY